MIVPTESEEYQKNVEWWDNFVKEEEEKARDSYTTIYCGSYNLYV